MPPNLTILRRYAQQAHPATTLPPSVLFTHTDASLTVFDVYPKSIFHFLILPRIVPGSLTVFNLANLRALLKCNKETSKPLLDKLAEDAKSVRETIEEEMVSRYDCKWPIWTGFHAVPSMEHLHLHVISADLCSPSMKNKKHYNSFHPKLGFFLHLDDVLSWFDAAPSYFDMMRALKPSQYEPLLKEDLTCWRCGEEFRNMPKLKAHLQKEWDEETMREKARLERKRKRARNGPADVVEGSPSKRQQTETGSSAGGSVEPHT